MKRIVFFAVTSVLLALPLVSSLEQKPEQESNADQITLLFAGDIMLDRGVEFYVKQNNNDWKFPFLYIAEFVKKADFAFANLESVISNKGTKLGSIYSFRADPEAVEGLVFAGFDAVSSANNHSLDYGAEALLDSIEILKQNGIAALGAGINKEAATEVLVKQINGTKIGIMAYTNSGLPVFEAKENSPGLAWVDETNLAEFSKRIRSAKEKVDILFVSMHFGEEYQKEPSATQELIAKTAIGSGANMVIGHHSHVVQPIEQYQQGWIAYSLGNFVFDQGFSKETLKGLLLKVVVKEKSIAEVMPLSVEISKEFQPTIPVLSR